MEKIRKQKSFWRTYGPVVMWWEDLYEIVSFFQENAKEVTISTEDYEFNTLEELKEHVGSQTTLFVLDIDSTAPSVSLDLGKWDPRLYIGAGPAAAHLFLALDSILSRCQRSFSWAYSFWFLILFPFAVGAVDHFFISWRTELLAQVLSAAIGPLASLWSVWGCYVRLRRVCVIKMLRRSERRPFLVRNQDQLIMLLVGAVVGGLVTFAGVVMKEHFYPSAPIVVAPKPP